MICGGRRLSWCRQGQSQKQPKIQRGARQTKASIPVTVCMETKQKHEVVEPCALVVVGTVARPAGTQARRLTAGMFMHQLEAK